MRTNRSLRLATVLVAFLGWCVLSNHCAIGVLVGALKTAKEHQCCHNGNNAPEKPASGEQPGQACCNGLSVALPDAISHGDLKPVFTHLLFEVAWVATAGLVEKASAPVLVGDTGPPPAGSFTELVLHRSLRSHAPPFVA